MLRYLKAAWWVRPRIPLLGAVPINPILAVCFLIFGIAGNAGFLLLGAGLIGAFVTALASNRRFQRRVDAQGSGQRTAFVEAKKEELIRSLDPPSLDHLKGLERKCARLIEIYRSQQVDEFVCKTNAQSLEQLQWLFLKLLIAREALLDHALETDEKSIRREMADIQKELDSDALTPSNRVSRKATLELLQKRLDNAGRRRQSMSEIDSDLRRIDTQVDLALDEATLRGTPTAISGNIELASQLLDPTAFGSSGQMILDLDAAFQEQRSGGSP